MPESPYEYIVRERIEESLFVELVKHIGECGYEGKFYNKCIIYFGHECMTCWPIGAPIDETTFINRCKKEDANKGRKFEGRLLESKIAK